MPTARPCSNATITIGGTALPGIIDASVTLTNEPIEVTEISATDRSYIGGMRTGTAQGNIFYDQADAQIAALEAGVQSGAAISFIWTWASSQTYTATAIVTSFSPSLAVNDVVKASFSLQLNAVAIG